MNTRYDTSDMKKVERVDLFHLLGLITRMVRVVSPEKTDERRRNIALHMQLLSHTTRCHSTTCTSVNCVKMKGLLKHAAECKVKAIGGCKVCIRVWALLQIHARHVRQRTVLYQTAREFVSATGS